MKPGVNIPDNDEEKYKQALADAVYHAVNLLKEEEIICSNVSNVISSVSKEIGREIWRRVKDIAQDIELVEDEEVMHKSDSDLEDDFEEVPEPQGNDEDNNKTPEFSESSEDERNGETKLKGHTKTVHRRVAWETRVKVVTMARMHPKWSFDTLRSKTTRLLTSRNQLWKWEQALERKGIPSAKQNVINDWTYKRFLGARSKKRQVTTEMLQQWATERAQEFNSESFKFIASRAWVDKFKRDRNILQRKIVKFINKADPPMLEVMLP